MSNSSDVMSYIAGSERSKLTARDFFIITAAVAVGVYIGGLAATYTAAWYLGNRLSQGINDAPKYQYP